MLRFIMMMPMMRDRLFDARRDAQRCYAEREMRYALYTLRGMRVMRAS